LSKSSGLFASRASVPNSRTSVPISAGFDTAPLVRPVFRLTYMYGIPVGESNAGDSRRPRSSASRSRRRSPVSSYPESRPPSSRIVTSKFLTVTSRSKVSRSRMSAFAFSASSGRPAIRSVSSESTGVIRSGSPYQS
jgi:hypothetical protein